MGFCLGHCIIKVYLKYGIFLSDTKFHHVMNLKSDANQGEFSTSTKALIDNCRTTMLFWDVVRSLFALELLDVNVGVSLNGSSYSWKGSALEESGSLTDFQPRLSVCVEQFIALAKKRHRKATTTFPEHPL